MNFEYAIVSPLEQFEILPIFGLLGINITNQIVISCLVLIFSIFLITTIVKPLTKSMYLLPNSWQFLLEKIYLMVLSLVVENVSNNRGVKYFPLIFTLFFFIAAMNLIGLVPYSFTITSHIFVTLTISLSIFIGMNIICVKRYKIKFFSLFLPSGVSAILAFLLVPVELISYIFKPLSLAIRLFCNMMAGHTLLKVFAGFAWTLIHFSGGLFLLHLVPIAILVPLYFLELGVALIQAYVFALLTCIYLNDALNLH